MMGRLNHDQGRLFYLFHLDEVVPNDHGRDRAPRTAFDPFQKSPAMSACLNCLN
jgi:hypothetical protein